MNTPLPVRLFTAGFTDLVSVIPPGAKLTPLSRIPVASIGKIPGMRKSNGLYAGYDWRKYVASADDVKRWCLEAANVGLRADRFPGVDIDCTDAAIAQIIEETAREKLGPAPVRIGKAPKRLLMYRTEAPFGRMRLFINLPNGERHLVEVLGAGQQYLVHGIHPATLRPYAWSTEEFDAASLTCITRDQVDTFLTHLGEVLDSLGVGTIEREGKGDFREDVAADQKGLRAPSVDLLREAVRVIPNTSETFPHRTDYLKMGYAIRASCGEEIDEGYAIYAEWAEKWDGGNDPETVLADWRRMKGPYAVGWTWIAEQAREHGFDTASLDFDAVSDAPDDAAAVVQAPLFSDQDLADRVIARQRGNIRYVPQQKRFLKWSGGRWQTDTGLLVEDLVKRELRVIAHGVLQRGLSPKERREAEVKAQAICASWKVDAVATLIKSDRAIAVDASALDHDPWILNTPAGMVDLRTSQMLPPNADMLCTKSTAVAPDFSSDCPLWLKFLREATGGNAEIAAYLQRLVGYALTGITREQHLSFIYGPGGNGKGTFLDNISWIMGDYAQQASMDTFTASNNDKHTTDLAMLATARLVTASETEEGKRWDESRIKALTGGDRITARFMRQDNFTFQPQFKLVFIGNHKPAIKTVDKAMRRRIQMIAFEHEPPVVDKALDDKLRAEWPAILAWMIQGCALWQEEGLSPPKSIMDTTEAYFEEEDKVGKWLKECCHFDPQATVTSNELYLSWREWAHANGEFPGTLKRLASALTTRKFPRWTEPQTRRKGFVGLKLRTGQDVEDLV